MARRGVGVGVGVGVARPPLGGVRSKPMDRPPAIRASDAERDRTVGLLQEAAAEGRLTFEELADRVEAASSARTREELEALTADLPLPPGAVTAPLPGPVAPLRERAALGDLRRSGVWLVPAESRWSTILGDIVLDLRQARVTAPEVVIDARTIFGDVLLLVPEGVVVEVRSRTILGSLRQRAGETGPPGAPRVILTGGTVFGDVRVRARRLREALAERLLGPSGERP
jgi:hypothetical protein